MIHDDRPCRTTSRRGFFAGTLGLGLGLGTAGPAARPARAHAGIALPGPALTPYERVLSQTDSLEVLGVPRSWSVVRQSFHPFAPERVAVFPSAEWLRHPGYRARGVRSRIESRIAQMRARYPRDDDNLPPEKLESCIWAMDLVTSHYRMTPEVFEDWVVGLVGRESLGSTGLGNHWGLVHQYQGRHGALVDCPPVDWWLFLFPGGIDWASLDGEPVHGMIGHVGRLPYMEEPGLMLNAWCLTGAIMRAVDDVRPVSRMGRVAAARHLNRITAECLEKKVHEPRPKRSSSSLKRG